MPKFQLPQYLYQHVRGKDVRLWETLNRIRMWLEGIGEETPLGPDSISTEVKCKDKATFGIGIGGVQPPGSDLTNHYEVRHEGVCFEAVANSKGPGTGTIRLDVQRSRDDGLSWNSIFPGAGSGGIVLVAGSMLYPRKKVTAFSPDYKDVQIGDLLRIDMYGSADWRGIEVVVKWG